MKKELSGREGGRERGGKEEERKEVKTGMEKREEKEME